MGRVGWLPNGSVEACSAARRAANVLSNWPALLHCSSSPTPNLHNHRVYPCPATGRRLNKMMSVQLVRLSAATAAANDDTVQVRLQGAHLCNSRVFCFQGWVCGQECAAGSCTSNAACPAACCLHYPFIPHPLDLPTPPPRTPQSRASSGRRRLPYTGPSAITVAVPLSAEEAEGEGGSAAVPVKASEWRPGPREPGQ